MNAEKKPTPTFAEHIAEIKLAMCDPSASTFFKTTLEWALKRDVVDALNDLAVIQSFLEDRLDGQLTTR